MTLNEVVQKAWNDFLNDPAAQGHIHADIQCVTNPKSETSIVIAFVVIPDVLTGKLISNAISTAIQKVLGPAVKEIDKADKHNGSSLS